MANSITLFKKYITLLDEVYKQGSRTAALDGNNDLVQQTANAGEFLIPKITMDGLADYSRGSGYVAGDVGISFETKSADYDRGRKFNVDTEDNAETAGIAFGTLASEFIRTQVVPELDAYRIAKYAGITDIGGTSGALSSGTDVLSALITATNAMDNDEVDLEDRILLINPTLLTNAQNVDTTKSQRIFERFSKTITVPEGRFYTGINLKDGTTTGETGGGFAPATGAYKINFMIIQRRSIIQFGKHVVNKVFSPSENQSADAWLFVYRSYGVPLVFSSFRVIVIIVIESFLVEIWCGSFILTELNHFFYTFFAFGLASIVELQFGAKTTKYVGLQ